MTRFASPALNQPELHLSAAAVRGLLGLAAVAFTGALWLAVALQAGRFGENDRTPRFELEPIVVSGHRVLPDDAAMAMGGPTECGNTPAAGGRNPVTLSQ